MSGRIDAPTAEWKAALTAAVHRPGRTASTDLVFLEEREDLVIYLDEAGVRTVRTGLRGVSLRTGSGPYRYRAVSDPEPQGLAGLAREPAPGREAEKAPGDAGPWAFDAAPLPAGPATRALEGLLGAAGSAAGPDRVRLRARYVGFDQRVAIARPERGIVADRRRGERIRLEVWLQARGAAAFAVGELRIDRDRPFDPVPLADRTVERARQRLDARPAPSGPSSAVFAAGVGGIVFHELVGHALEGDGAATAASPLAGEDATASAALRVIDDPRRGRGAWTVDDEGQPARATSLIDRGKVSGRLHDLRSAREAGAAPTGHGRRASYREPVLPRMGCTFVAAGDAEPAEILEGLADAVHVRRIEGAVAHTVSGSATFRVVDADRILRGRPAEPCKPFLLRIGAADLLRGIGAIGRDLRFDTCIGSCVRDGQPLVVSVGAPTICLPLTILLP